MDWSDQLTKTHDITSWDGLKRRTFWARAVSHRLFVCLSLVANNLLVPLSPPLHAPYDLFPCFTSFFFGYEHCVLPLGAWWGIQWFYLWFYLIVVCSFFDCSIILSSNCLHPLTPKWIEISDRYFYSSFDLSNLHRASRIFSKSEILMGGVLRVTKREATCGWRKWGSSMLWLVLSNDSSPLIGSPSL